MSEVHRYSVVKMLTEAGNKITYDPHGPEVVLAADYDALAQRCRELEKVSDDAIVRNTFLETECDDLRTELDQLRRWEKEVRENSPLLIRLDSVEAERDTLRAEVELLRKDAARYYWLRDHWHGFDYLRHGVIPGVTVESEIDRVMARSISEATR